MSGKRLFRSKMQPKMASVSQNVIVKNIMAESINTRNKMELKMEGNLGNIYSKMMNDVDWINDKLNRKDIMYFNWGIGFLGVEEEIQRQRKELVEFMTKQMELVRLKEMQDELNNRRKVRTDRVNSGRKSVFNKAVGKKEEKIEKKRKKLGKPRKRLSILSKKVVENGEVERVKPEIKEEGTVNLVNIISKDNRKRKSTELDEGGLGELTVDAGELVNATDEGLSTTGREGTEKKCVKVQKIHTENEPDELDVEIVDLSTDESGGSSNLNHNNKGNVMKKSKSSRKEHTLVDKLLLGVSCIRTWTDSGLQLTKLAEKDLVLLNRRCASINCSISRLTEHKDDNNNSTYLSVLLQSDLFKPYLNTEFDYPNPKIEPSTESVVSKPPSTIYTRLTLTKPLKQHIPAMYRQRHSLPSILSKPPQNLNSCSTSNNSSSNSNKLESNYPKFTYSTASQHNSTNNIVQQTTKSTTAQIICDSSKPEVLPTASELLKLKFQSDKIAAKRKLLAQNEAEAESSSNGLSRTLPSLTPAPPIKVTIQPCPPVLYRRPNNMTLHTTRLIPLNNQTASIITKLQRIQMPLSHTHSQYHQHISSTSSVSSTIQGRNNPNTTQNSSSAQSQILKNLLQQSDKFKQQQQQRPQIVPIKYPHSANGMMSFSELRSTKHLTKVNMSSLSTPSPAMPTISSVKSASKSDTPS